MISGHKFSFLFLRLSLVLYAGAFHCPQTLAQQHDFWGEDSKGAPTPGQHAFNTNCVGCHGLDGRGSDKGPNIAASGNVRASFGRSSIRIISMEFWNRSGLPQLQSAATSSIVGTCESYRANLKLGQPPATQRVARKYFSARANAPLATQFPATEDSLAPTFLIMHLPCRQRRFGKRLSGRKGLRRTATGQLCLPPAMAIAWKGLFAMKTTSQCSFKLRKAAFTCFKI